MTCFGFETVASDLIPSNGETGRYILPCGKVVVPEDVKVTTRFVEYGPEDIEWLLYAGIIEKEIGPTWFLINKAKLASASLLNLESLIQKRLFGE